MTTFSPAETAYLRAGHLGRLATVSPGGVLQNSPVGFTLDEATGTIEVGGFAMSRSRKYRNVQADPRVAFVVDDVVSTDPWRVRCLEIRGRAEAVPGPGGTDGADGADRAVIRIHPQRVISFGVDRTDQEPHEMTAHNRDV